MTDRPSDRKLQSFDGRLELALFLPPKDNQSPKLKAGTEIPDDPSTQVLNLLRGNFWSHFHSMSTREDRIACHATLGCWGPLTNAISELQREGYRLESVQDEDDRILLDQSAFDLTDVASLHRLYRLNQRNPGVPLQVLLYPIQLDPEDTLRAPQIVTIHSIAPLRQGLWVLTIDDLSTVSQSGTSSNLEGQILVMVQEGQPLPEDSVLHHSQGLAFTYQTPPDPGGDGEPIPIEEKFIVMQGTMAA